MLANLLPCPSFPLLPANILQQNDTIPFNNTIIFKGNNKKEVSEEPHEQCHMTLLSPPLRSQGPARSDHKGQEARMLEVIRSCFPNVLMI